MPKEKLVKELDEQKIEELVKQLNKGEAKFIERCVEYENSYYIKLGLLIFIVLLIIKFTFF